jgi:TonB family protein
MRTLALLMVATAFAAQDPVDFSGWMGRGVQEFQAAHYPAAVAAFERAVAIDPSNVSGQLYLATANMQQFIPGAESAKNQRLADAARMHFLRVLDLDRSNGVALASIASLFLNENQWEDALQWYEKLVAVEPNNADAYYSMGFIAWSKWFPAYGKARADLGMRQEEPGPIKDAAVRADLTARYGPVLDSGLHALEKALEINPQFDDAMVYMNLLVRERADLRDTPEEYERDTAIADEWVQKALATKKAKASGGGDGGGGRIVDSPTQSTVNWRMSVTAATPPPPPPPPERAQTDYPRRIRIGGTVMQDKLIRAVPPVSPNEPGVHVKGDVCLSVVIDNQGRVTEIKVISGHPMLIPAALEAVRHWEYEPTLLNGDPIAVETEVSVTFK